MSNFDSGSSSEARSKETRSFFRDKTGKPEINEKDASIARAEARLREIRGNMPEGGALRDKFWAPDAPNGWTYEWKVRTVMNEEMSSYIVELARNGWEAVPLSRHPEMMPKGWTGNTIEVEGLVLMERPSVLTEEDRAAEAREARNAVLTKEMQMRESRSGDLGQRQVHSLNKSRGPISIPGDE